MQISHWVISQRAISQVFLHFRVNQVAALDDPTEGWIKRMRYANYRGKAWLWIGFLILLSACRVNGITETPTVEATLLIQSTHCWNKNVEPFVEWITNSEAYKSAYSQTRKHILGDSSKPPHVDFNRLGVIAVYMGGRPTAGYQVNLASRTAEVGEHNELTLLVSWIEPPVDALLAQIITSPDFSPIV